MAKEKSITEMRAEASEFQKRATAIVEKAKGENRKLNEGEERDVNAALLELSQLRIDIATREAMNAKEGRPAYAPKNFSLRKAILEMVDGGSYSEDVAAVNQAGVDIHGSAGLQIRNARGLILPMERRDSFTATGAAGTGSDLIETDFLDILTPLRDRLVLTQAGATMLTGLVGNIDIPAYSGSTSNWEGENVAAKDGGGTFSHKTMKPKRITSKLMVSRQLLIQDSLSIENMLRADLINSVISKLEATILGNHAKAENMPDGLFTGYSGTAADLSWDGIVDLETGADLANTPIDNAAYILHTSLRGKAKKTVKKSAGALGFIIDPDGTMNGYRALRTNAIADNFQEAEGENPAVPATEWGALFGNWADLLIGQWGALDLMVDPYTKADEAFVRIIVNSYWDASVRRDGSIAKAMFK